jgi:hypothetical protein
MVREDDSPTPLKPLATDGSHIRTTEGVFSATESTLLDAVSAVVLDPV